MATKMTFSLDETTVSRLRATAARLRKPQSQVIREAVADYAARADRLSDGERHEQLRALDHFAETAPTTGTGRSVDRELREIRAARHAGGRRSSVR
jgi:predicted transcriptional regulator